MSQIDTIFLKQINRPRMEKRISKASYSIYIGISRSARIKSTHKHIGY